MHLNDILLNLEKLNCTLIGSRMMGFDKPDSDYDYMAYYSDSLIQSLISLGFESIIDTDDYFPVFDDFFRLVLNDGTKIEVQVFENQLVLGAVYLAYLNLSELSVLRYVAKPYRKIIFMAELLRNLKKRCPGETDKIDNLECSILGYQDYGLDELNNLRTKKEEEISALFSFNQ